ncbi:MAG: carboxynorspermidine decarboxylase [Rhodobiaceae bacterium]|nr:carboxynorspermidine decarboxylase [Rhodobiaceae bacterium]MCC0056028.1 carboxynorspermidine decarboxylase [Rhodobiaceae bacterium]
MIDTPYYLIDTEKLRRNLEIVDSVRSRSGARVLLALKCFATWSVFDVMNGYMDGTTSSSLFEARLGHEMFGGETHAYSVAFSDDDFAHAVTFADKVIFNSLDQLRRFAPRSARLPLGLRLNPGNSSSEFDLADPARPFSRLGEVDPARIAEAAGLVSGYMIHNNCENADFAQFDRLLSQAEAIFGRFFHDASWISLGGGIHFTGDGYPLEAFCARLKAFAETYRVQVYLEPGEAVVTDAASLEVSVLDTVFNGRDIAVIDASAEAHMLDLLIYRQEAEIRPGPGIAAGEREYVVAGRSCLAGDVFGAVRVARPLEVGDRLSIRDAAGYTMVKKNWFNGLQMPSIVRQEEDGSERLIRRFDYQDFVAGHS